VPLRRRQGLQRLRVESAEAGVDRRRLEVVGDLSRVGLDARFLERATLEASVLDLLVEF
jgi:hypothetical protein